MVLQCSAKDSGHLFSYSAGIAEQVSNNRGSLAENIGPTGRVPFIFTANAASRLLPAEKARLLAMIATRG
jgi:hypothetical protein